MYGCAGTRQGLPDAPSRRKGASCGADARGGTRRKVLSAGQYGLRGTDEQHVRRPGGKQPDRHDAGDLVEFALKPHRIGNDEAVDVQDVVAVVGHEALPPYRPAAARTQLPGDEAARHRDHLDGEREPAEGADELAVIDDAHEAPGGRGDDLLARQGAAAAFDQVALGGGLIGAVDVQVEPGELIEVE